MDLSSAKKIISQYNLEKYIEILLDYWEKHPTSAGHGFAHVLKVAQNSFELGVKNNYENPDELFVGGLFHDIYRPIRDEGGNEDQTKGADITRKLFEEKDIDKKLTSKVVSMILSHDSWRDSNQPPMLDLLISVGDKISHSALIAYSYVWASNKFAEEQGKEKMFSNHFHTLYVFNKYQQRAWDIFMKFNKIVNGMDQAIESYLNIYSEATKNHLDDPKGERFNEKVLEYIKRYNEEEKAALKAFDLRDDRIKKLMIRMR